GRAGVGGDRLDADRHAALLAAAILVFLELSALSDGLTPALGLGRRLGLAATSQLLNDVVDLGLEAVDVVEGLVGLLLRLVSDRAPGLVFGLQILGEVFDLVGRVGELLGERLQVDGLAVIRCAARVLAAELGSAALEGGGVVGGARSKRGAGEHAMT